MADTAAFFAKKKKKKSLKFNGNKIDATQVISTVHVDAPAVSSAVDNTVSTLKAMNVKDPKAPGDNEVATANGGGDWDDVALSNSLQKNIASSTVATSSGTGGAAELLDMKALEKKRNEQDDIAERLRVEETKAKLKAAKEGMEKEGQRLKEEKEAKAQPFQTVTTGGSRFGKASANIFGGSSGGGAPGDKWVPSHMRGGSGITPRTMSSSHSGYQRKVDTQDENLFPDLATADKIIAKEEEQKQIANRKAKAPTAAWGMKRVSPKEPSPQVKQSTSPPPPSPPAPTEEKVEIKEEPVAVAKPDTKPAPAAAGLKKKTKKKKKDLSTFKPS